MVRKAAVILIVLLGCGGAFAQQPAVELRMTPQVLEPGESVLAQLVCTNITSPEPPSAGSVEGIEVSLESQQPQVFRSTTIVNGQMTSTETNTFVLRFTARKEGVWDLGPFQVKAGGQTYETGPVRIVVRKPPPQEAKGKGDLLMYVEIEVDPKSLYVTESCTAILRIGFRKLIFGGRPVEADLLASCLDYRGSQLSVFSNTIAERKYSAAEKQLAEKSGKRFAYVEYTIVQKIRADQAGDLMIGPIFLKANYPTELGRDVFGDLKVRSTERVTARAEALSVRTKAPPQAGRPTSYAGAIGRFEMYVSAAPTRVLQGQPVTLSIEIRGEPLAGVAGPDLSAQPELVSRFDFQQEELAGELEQGAKVFRRAIFPRQQGEQTIPPISWSFFDSRSEKYVTVTSVPIPITVDPGSSDTQPLVLSGLDAPVTEDETTLTLLAGGISPNYPASVLLADQRFAMGPVGYAVLGATPIAFAAVSLLTRRRERLRNDAGYARKSRARSRAEEQVRRALRSSDRTEQFHGLAAALAGFIGDRCGLGTGVLTPLEAREALQRRGIEPSLISPIVSFLESCESIRYAPGGSQALDPHESAGFVRAWLASLERATR